MSSSSSFVFFFLSPLYCVFKSQTLSRPPTLTVTYLSPINRLTPHPPPLNLTSMVSILIGKGIFKCPPIKPPWKLCISFTPSLFSLRSNNYVGVYIVLFSCVFSIVFFNLLQVCTLCLLKCLREVRFISFVVRVSTWLSQTSTCFQPYKWIVYMW